MTSKLTIRRNYGDSQFKRNKGSGNVVLHPKGLFILQIHPNIIEGTSIVGSAVPFYGEFTIQSPPIAKFYMLIGQSTKMARFDWLTVKRPGEPD